MALAGITENISLELSNKLTPTVFAANRAGAKEQLQTPLVEDLRESDFVSLSDQALKLSLEALTPKSPAEETKQE